jgi:hypothetical protein
VGRTYERLSARLPEGGALAQLMAANLPPPRQLMNELTRSDPASLAGDALATSGWLLERLSAVLIVLILALHWTAAGDRLTRFGLVLIPAHRRAWARLVLADVASAVGRQLAGGLMKGYLALLVFAVGFRALGVPFPTLLAVIVAALAVVPLVGVLLGPGLVLAVTWNQSPGAALSAALATAALMLLLDRVLARRLLDAGDPTRCWRSWCCWCWPGRWARWACWRRRRWPPSCTSPSSNWRCAGPRCGPTPSRASACGWTSSASRSCCPNWTAWPARWRPSPTRPTISAAGR